MGSDLDFTKLNLLLSEFEYQNIIKEIGENPCLSCVVQATSYKEKSVKIPEIGPFGPILSNDDEDDEYYLQFDDDIELTLCVVDLKCYKCQKYYDWVLLLKEKSSKKMRYFGELYF